MGRHFIKITKNRPLPRPASHSILYWEILKLIKRKNGDSKSLFNKKNHDSFRRYKTYRVFLRLRQYKLAIEQKNRTLSYN